MLAGVIMSVVVTPVFLVWVTIETSTIIDIGDWWCGGGRMTGIVVMILSFLCLFVIWVSSGGYARRDSWAEGTNRLKKGVMAGVVIGVAIVFLGWHIWMSFMVKCGGEDKERNCTTFVFRGEEVLVCE